MDRSLNKCQQNALDIFRIIAAFSVLIGHSFSFYQLTLLKDSKYFPNIQDVGVVMFFLLSGFLTIFSIKKKLINKPTYNFRDFFVHKVIRINKEYLPGLLLIYIIDCFSIYINGDLYKYYNAFDLKTFISNVFMLQNMGPGGILKIWFVPFGSGRPLWTLSVEWWLYMLFGLLVFILINKEKVNFEKITLIGIALFMSCHYLISGRGNGLGFVFMLGVLTYYLYSLLKYKMSLLLFISSLLLYFIYGVMMKDAYTVYSFILLWGVFLSMHKNMRRTSLQTKQCHIFCF